jgi:hypothetical protein
MRDGKRVVTAGANAKKEMPAHLRNTFVMAGPDPATPVFSLDR